MIRTLFFLAALVVSLTVANSLHAGGVHGAGHKGAPELQRAIKALSGSWVVSEEFPPSAVYPKGGVGRGTEVWRAGPGNITLVYEYHSTNPGGEMWATAVLWWDSEKKGLRELWCTDHSAKGCKISTADIRWEGDELVFRDSYEEQGQQLFSREVVSDIKADAHSLTIAESKTNGDFKPWLISRAVRVK